MAEKRSMNLSTKRRISNIISYVTLAIISIVWILPFIFLVLKSFDVYNPGVTSYILPTNDAGKLIFVDELGKPTLGFGNYIYLFSSECNFLGTRRPLWISDRAGS